MSEGRIHAEAIDSKILEAGLEHQKNYQCQKDSFKWFKKKTTHVPSPRFSMIGWTTILYNVIPGRKDAVPINYTLKL